MTDEAILQPVNAYMPEPEPERTGVLTGGHAARLLILIVAHGDQALFAQAAHIIEERS